MPLLFQFPAFDAPLLAAGLATALLMLVGNGLTGLARQCRTARRTRRRP